MNVSFYLLCCVFFIYRVAIHLRNLQKSGYLTLVGKSRGNKEKSGKLWSASGVLAVVIVTKLT